MAKGTALGIKQKGLRQENLPQRFRFTLLGESNNKLMFKGFLSICPLVYTCFGEYDSPLEFFLTVNSKTKELKVSPKL